MSVKLEPYADQVVVRPIVDTYKGAIVLLEGAKEKPTKGEVVAVGPGRYAPETGARIAPDAKVGDVVIYSKYAGTDVKIDEQDLVILKEKDLLVAVREV